ncbi:ABC transporter substrate-binding protein [Chelatococcus sambhunathii]|uniref:ABC transporter substrate-binding protein n=1 Tax=Chelatococcus sambhunathii TaxID=363953 RepID=A0ABU1DD87_9HYPH|nr:ABC transporter substrate-binding protein [Chelatococcus sambhunathii]MDR4306004.1 ABC transporter substrate-binding protein [Chelatococcus sambhunathii]
MTATPQLLLRALAAAAVCGALLAAPATAQAAEKLRLLTSWYAQAEHGGFYEAKATGLYGKAGLDVEIRMGGPQVKGMQLLLAGEVDAILGYDLQVLDAVEKGLPAVTVAASFQYDLQGMMTHEDVRSLDDLKDRVILVSTSGRTTWWPWFKAKYGADDAQAKAYTFSLTPFFADPKIAQQAYPSSEPFQAQEKGVPANFFLFAKEGYPPYGTTIVVTRKTLEEKRAAIGAFVKASMEGWRDYLGNPAPANALIKADNPKMTDAQIAFGIAKMKELGALDAEGRTSVGQMTGERWKATRDYMVGAGLLKAEADWTKAFTTEFVKDLSVRLD